MISHCVREFEPHIGLIGSLLSAQSPLQILVSLSLPLLCLCCLKNKNKTLRKNKCASALEVVLLIFNFFLMFIFKRQREHKWGRSGERGRQNPQQAPGSELSVQSLTWGSNSWTARSWPELKSAVNHLSHPGAPSPFSFLNFVSGRGDSSWRWFSYGVGEIGNS